MKKIRVLMTRQEVVPERLSGATAVVIDVFMATTTLLTILENGARGVYPVASLEEADGILAGLDPDGVLRGGEQDAERIEGFDHGPFPEEYAPEVVREKDVVFVTTNGTRAIADTARAERVLLGTLRNAPAVARRLEESNTESAYLVCAGSWGRFTLEDFLAAAAILSAMDLDGWQLDDGAWLARDLAGHHAQDVSGALGRSRAGRWFVENDRSDTFDFVADVGASDLVPEVVRGKLRPAGEPEDGPSSGAHDADQGGRS